MSSTKLSGAERRGQIINVARHLFATEKYQKTTMATIAKAVGVTEPLIYKHFKSKKDLFLTILKDCHQTIALITSDFLKQKGKTAELYLSLFNLFFQNMQNDPDRAKVCILAAGLEDEDIRSEIRIFDDNLEKILIEDLKNRSDISLSGKPEAIARILMSLMVERAHLIMIEKNEDVDSVFNDSISLVLSSISLS